MLYAAVHHDTMIRAINTLGAKGYGRTKTLRCRYLQRPYITNDRITSYRNNLPGMVNIHQDKDLRRQMAASRCQNDIKCQWDNELEMESRNKNAVLGSSGRLSRGNRGIRWSKSA
jgi:hypothetical protein